MRRAVAAIPTHHASRITHHASRITEHLLDTLPNTLIPEQLGLRALSELLRAALDGVIVVDGARQIVYANPALGEIAGRTTEALIGRDFLDLIAPRAREQIVGYFSATLAGQPDMRSSIALRPDGTEREIEYAPVLLQADGRVLVAAIVRDVTEQRRHTREAAALAHIAATLTVDQPMSATLDALARAVAEATTAEACLVILIDEQPLRYRLIGGYGFGPGFEEALEAVWPAMQHTPILQSLKARTTRVVHDLPAKNLANPALAPLRPFVEHAAWDTLVSVPLVYRGRGLGLLNAYYPPQPAIDDGAIALLKAIANQVAVVVENANLFFEAQEKAALEERQRLARELHDSVSQALYGIALGAQSARTLLERDPSQAVEPLEYILQLANAGLTEMRALIFELRPESLETDGLVAALERQTSAARARHGLTIDAQFCDEPDASLAVKEALMRTAQEALHNIVKHARARCVSVRLEATIANLTLEVSDDGVGFDSGDAFPGHLGLRSMRERAVRLGGSFELTSVPGQGTCVRVRMPLGR